ncbi:LEAF RUST 10 DISEASE-RESISTANCE LOCUS RECEPTOR-LIKE PROTEIN KINASE-like 2.4 isoform X2 [Momordica charantia]|uniref:LEAF RUST 10 DISEASE-RESISTANCE LOCUS RECEPTOR-LIKE PROTEIN KINASE-like 2.4 isoform X2 n=1 Tax=Momordica charantia TaxID=3673 RepID=A0A6J1C5R7_MOMCH|nr:LEAF RUST 10 DISEASE-RESISTANCE LOCUS RECEPTOR-LIKE PROTEIN KINASE-like 2.4 isoform X2 [Momordica charantia]
MNSRLFPFRPLHLSLAFMLLMLLNSSPASSAFYGEWFLNCNDPLKCESIGTLEFPLWRNNRTGTCSYPETMKVNCDGSRGTTIEILGAEYELLSFNTNDQILIIARRIREQFDSDLKVDAQACRSCSVSGGIFGYEDSINYNPFFFSQAKCFCKSSSNGFELCSSSRVAAPATSPSGSGKSKSLKKIFIIVAISSGSIILVISIIIFTCYARKSISSKDEIDEIIKRYSIHTPKRYSYSKLKKITCSFKNKLGQGGFSTVYKGKLSDGHDVAVKLLNDKENSQDFMNEVISITRTSHVNIATLLGFCYERNKRALIYEYMPKGSLEKYIFNKRLQKNEVVLDWNTLYSIIIGVARGLEYLHRGCNTRILHFDIKPHNILLDKNFCPKISDFGLAKQCKAKESHVSMTGVKGTAGFMAPEVIFKNYGKVSHKADVYSYGMLVTEMVGERKNRRNEGVEESSEEYFPDWIYNDLKDGGLWWGNTEEEEEMARKIIIVGLHCIQTLPDDRPSMSDVVAMLEGSGDGLQIPPKPTLFGPPTTSTTLPHPSSSFSYSSSTSSL